ncbi:MAG: hypothetical protein U0228_07300 [Myxococcaceae bacterium]
MSGSSHADQALSRCEVSLDAGVSISWAPDPDGSYEHGQRHHEQEEAAFRAQMVRATPALEVLFDELETEGHVFTPPTDAAFHERCQRGHGRGLPIVEVRVWCAPKLSEERLQALLARVEALLAAAKEEPREPESVTVLVPEEPVVVAAVKPWWKFW